MIRTLLIISLIQPLLFVVAYAGSTYQLAKPGKLLLKENFDESELPELFRVGQGRWDIVDGVLRGRQLAADNHTAFRKIYLDHQDVIYEYDMKLEGDGFHRLLINWGLAHIAKAEIHYDRAEVVKIREQGKRDQMTREGHDHGLDPLKGNWDEKTYALNTVPVDLREGNWYHVIIELVGDTISLQVGGKTVVGKHIGLTEKKDNFWFQSGGLESYLYVDNVRVYEASPKKGK